jgi:hypothetical protein
VQETYQVVFTFHTQMLHQIIVKWVMSLLITNFLTHDSESFKLDWHLVISFSKSPWLSKVMFVAFRAARSLSIIMVCMIMQALSPFASEN